MFKKKYAIDIYGESGLGKLCYYLFENNVKILTIAENGFLSKRFVVTVKMDKHRWEELNIGIRCLDGYLGDAEL